jgi:hypothetical protein
VLIFWFHDIVKTLIFRMFGLSLNFSVSTFFRPLFNFMIINYTNDVPMLNNLPAINILYSLSLFLIILFVCNILYESLFGLCGVNDFCFITLVHLFMYSSIHIHHNFKFFYKCYVSESDSVCEKERVCERESACESESESL